MAPEAIKGGGGEGTVPLWWTVEPYEVAFPLCVVLRVGCGGLDGRDEVVADDTMTGGVGVGAGVAVLAAAAADGFATGRVGGTSIPAALLWRHPMG